MTGVQTENPGVRALKIRCDHGTSHLHLQGVQNLKGGTGGQQEKRSDQKRGFSKPKTSE